MKNYKEYKQKYFRRNWVTDMTVGSKKYRPFLIYDSFLLAEKA